MVMVILIVLSLTGVKTGMVPIDKCEALARAAIHEHIGDRAVCIGPHAELLFAAKDEGDPA